MSKRKDTKAIWQASAALGTIAGLAALCTWQNNRITVSHYRCGSDKLAAPFEGFTILQVSDLHNKRFGKQQHKLLEAIRQQAPDCIVITGDLVDCHRTNIAAAMEFVRGAVRMAPVYYVPGNHEGRIDAYRRLREELLRAGVVLLEDRKVMLARQGACIQLLGLRDPRFAPKEHRQDRERVEKKLRELMGTEEDRQFFQLLLSRRPELMPVYADCGVDMVLCGHAHGGQFRLFHQGLFAPQQGLFPQYTGGVHVKGTTATVISRGLGNSEFPLRLNNPPELVEITLHCQPPAEEAGQAEEDE